MQTRPLRRRSLPRLRGGVPPTRLSAWARGGRGLEMLVAAVMAAAGLTSPACLCFSQVPRPPPASHSVATTSCRPSSRRAWRGRGTRAASVRRRRRSQKPPTSRSNSAAARPWIPPGARPRSARGHVRSRGLRRKIATDLAVDVPDAEGSPAPRQLRSGISNALALSLPTRARLASGHRTRAESIWHGLSNRNWRAHLESERGNSQTIARGR
mmetsp:Transcript_85168/g.244459  ORF Transcript_85168/g.244459 Transcript_85168/m.244459 type:complete len:212 (+) Transcript_85168:1089-1724(+)